MTRPFTYLSLFSGIGGLDLGLDRAGMTCVGQVELDDLNRSVLDRHWPEVPKHDDVRTAVPWWTARPRPAVRLVAGGYPCQPFARSGRRRGTADERWGWPWFRAVVRAVRPDYVLVENVAALLDDADAFGWMLGDLAADGFDADWTVLPACAVGAPHTRERLFLVAYPSGELRQARLAKERRQGGQGPLRPAGDGQHAWRRPDVWVEAARRPDRVVDGLAAELVAAGGNAVVPQVAEHVGRLILAHAGWTPAVDEPAAA
ncbi:DNA cytosine methyltransferase [Micromonospora tulbaghiae]|uniref:DNA cytosine methyltransferase n=1 Tax=Micromonospora tulbaghiae TaxID=479978 RepID=UPI003414A9E5